jgi:drug/metabolite transporter (DMT)-like permease
VRARERWVGPLCAVVGVLGFSFKAILIKLAYAWHPIDAVTLLALRMLFAAPLFAAMAWWASTRPGQRPLERLVLFLYPTIVVLLGAAWKGTPITRRAMVALALSYGGIAVVFAQDASGGGDARGVLTGGALVFGSALLYALYLVGAGGVMLVTLKPRAVGERPPGEA